MNEPATPDRPTAAQIEAYERFAESELRKLGELENARRWLRNGVDDGWRYGPLAFAYTEMPTGVAGSLMRFLGIY